MSFSSTSTPTSTFSHPLLQHVFATLRRWIAVHSCPQVVCAFSGGGDSTALLYLLVKTGLPAGVNLLAAHVNHGIGVESAKWEEHCKSVCHILGVPCICMQARLGGPQRNLEALAREERYRLLRSVMCPQALLLTAHHQGDQAETFLLRLFRGSGPSGLQSMKDIRSFADGWLGRPLLQTSREELREFLKSTGVDQWVEDTSNYDVRSRRNYIRCSLGPKIAKIWPAWEQKVVQTCAQLRAANTLLDQMALSNLQRCLNTRSLGRHDRFGLSIHACAKLPIALRALVVRKWLDICRLPVPQASQLARILDDFIDSPRKNGRQYSYAGYTLYASQGVLNVTTASKGAKDVATAHLVRPSLIWANSTSITLEDSRVLAWHELARQAPTLADLPEVEIRFRRGGEWCGYGNEGHHKTLKKVFQEYAVAAIERPHVPLIYVAGVLRLVWACTECVV